MAELNGNGRKLNTNTAISLGLTIALVGGAAAFLSRVPTTDTIRVIVNDAIDPIERRMHEMDLRLSRIEERLKLTPMPDGGRG